MALLSALQIAGSKLVRIVASLVAMTGYLLFCVMLFRFGYLDTGPPVFYTLLTVWGVVLAALVVFDVPNARFDRGSLTFIKALWCNVGVVATALVVPASLRPLMLVVPLFGVLYTALHLERKHVLVVGTVTWFTYVLGALLLNDMRFVDGKSPGLSTEGTVVVAFAFMLIVMIVMGGEVTALRKAFAHRRERLKQAMERLPELAMRDELTGLYNRRYIMDALSQQKAVADRGRLGFAVLYCDLDHFKRINDRFGHQSGDRALCDFGKLAASVVRSIDYVARIGGEEFLLVLVGADINDATIVAERLCKRTRNLPISSEGGDYHLTVSIGVASFRSGERVEDVIQRADLAVYRAKSGGRDQISVLT